MIKKKPPQEVDMWSRPYKIKVTIKGIERSWLIISYHYKKRNVEYLRGCKKDKKKPDPNRLFNNQVIRDIVQQLHEKELESKQLEYYDYKRAVDKRNNRVYHIVILLKNESPSFVYFINLLYL